METPISGGSACGGPRSAHALFCASLPLRERLQLGIARNALEESIGDEILQRRLLLNGARALEIGDELREPLVHLGLSLRAVEELELLIEREGRTCVDLLGEILLGKGD